jgi:hypothetical protein
MLVRLATLRCFAPEQRVAWATRQLLVPSSGSQASRNKRRAPYQLVSTGPLDSRSYSQGGGPSRMSG